MNHPAAASTVDKLNALKKEQFVALYRETHGHITDTCRAIEISRTTFYTWLQDDATFAQAIEDANAELNDEMRQALIEKARVQGDTGAIIFWLKKRHPDFKDTPHAAVAVQINTVVNEDRDRFK